MPRTNLIKTVACTDIRRAVNLYGYDRPITYTPATCRRSADRGAAAQTGRADVTGRAGQAAGIAEHRRSGKHLGKGRQAERKGLHGFLPCSCD